LRESRLQELLAELTCGDDLRAENSIPEIVQLGMAAIPALLDLTRSADVDSRWWAVRALAASPHARTEDLIPLLGDSAPEVRSAAALALCDHPHESAVEVLIKTLADEDSITAGLAGNALVKIGKPAVLPLTKIVWNASLGVHVRVEALRALAQIGDHRAIPVMMKVLDEESALLQYWAKEGLNRLGLNMVYIKP
jgi:HEAT repeat protein